MSISEAILKSVHQPTKELELFLSEVAVTAQLFSCATRLRPRLNGMLHWDVLGAEERSLVDHFFDCGEAKENTAYLSLIVICYGLFENHLRSVLERSVLAVSAQLNDFGKIPEELARENIFRTGSALRTVKKPLPHNIFDYAVLGKNLGTCVPGLGAFTLNEQCFSFEVGVLTSENIDKMFRRVGVKLDWNKFGASGEIQKIFGEMKTKSCAKALAEFLDDFVRKRNTVSHSGGSQIVVDENYVHMSVSLIPLFCSVLVAQVASQLQNKYG